MRPACGMWKVTAGPRVSGSDWCAQIAIPWFGPMPPVTSRLPSGSANWLVSMPMPPSLVRGTVAPCRSSTERKVRMSILWSPMKAYSSWNCA